MKLTTTVWILVIKKKKNASRCTCVAQLVRWLTLDFHSGHDLGVLGLGPALGSVLGGESA